MFLTSKESLITENSVAGYEFLLSSNYENLKNLEASKMASYFVYNRGIKAEDFVTSKD